MAGPTLLLCIGATKAGTTWLYDYLRGHPDCHLQPVKELHYFDTRKGELQDFYLSHADTRLANLRAKRSKTSVLKKRGVDAQIRSVQAWRDLIAEPGPDHSKYLDYVMSGAGRAKLVADITPCYATLDRADFAEMRDLAPDVRFVFLLRDPVDRVWSQARMNGRRRSAKHGRRSAEEASHLSFTRFLNGEEPTISLRSDYARTLHALRAEIPPARLYVEFYEHLFTPEALSRLTDFLGIAPHDGDFQTISHGGSDQQLTPEETQAASDVLQDQYHYCAEMFDGHLPDRWQNRMQLAQ